VLGGMAWAAIVALLRDKANANEILVSLMLVYVAEMVLSYLVYGPGRTRAATTSRRRSPSSTPTRCRACSAACSRQHRLPDRAAGGGGVLAVPVPQLLPASICRSAASRRRRRATRASRRAARCDGDAGVRRHGRCWPAHSRPPGRSDS
jgi:hypothetical protein